MLGRSQSLLFGVSHLNLKEANYEIDFHVIFFII